MSQYPSTEPTDQAGENFPTNFKKPPPDDPPALRRMLLKRVMEEGLQPVEATFALRVMFRDCLITNWCAMTGLSYHYVEREHGLAQDFFEFYLPETLTDNDV